jgi:hypothetical protein
MASFLAVHALPVVIEYCPQMAGLWGQSQIDEFPDS